MFIDPGNLRKYSEYLGLGAEIAAAMIVPLLIGYGIDKKFKTTPWGIIIGALFGFLGIFSIIYKLVVQSDVDNNGQREKK